MSKRRWIYGLSGAVLVAVLVALGIGAIFETGWLQEWAGRALIQGIEQRTGAKVEWGAFHLRPWNLSAEIENLTLHGLEQGGAPLFRADRVSVSVRILSFFGRRIVLDRLIVERPQVSIRVDPQGRSNIPTPPTPASASGWRDSLFRLQISLLDLRDGSASFNDRKTPLTMQGRDFEFSLHYDAPANGPDAYIGNFQWRQVQMAYARDLPFRFDISTKFTLHRDALDVDELVWKLPHSELNLRAELPSFKNSDWNLHYRGRLSLADVRSIFRAPSTPDGIADFSGQAQYLSTAPAGQEWTASGYYKGHDIRMNYVWFHASGMETWGDYQVEHQRLVVPNLNVRALAGALQGQLEMNFKGLAFRTETHLQGARLAAALAAVDNPDLPVHTLHWDGLIDVESVNTWNANFQHFRTAGKSQWSPPATSTTGIIPISAQIDYDYSTDNNTIALSRSEISTPTAEIDMDGPLSAKDSALEVSFRANDLRDWDDFINVLRGTDVAPRLVTGQATWKGRILGPLVDSTFIGHMDATQARYDKLYWDAIDGDLEYSPDRFRLTNTTVRRGSASARINLNLQFDGDWSFLADSPWTLDGRIDEAASADLQAMFNTNYPVSGLLSGEFHGSGTRASPVFDSTVDFQKIETKGFQFDRLTGQLHYQHDELQLTSAELRKGMGRVTGNVTYRPEEQDFMVDLAGAGIELRGIDKLQTAAMPIAGQLDFRLRGSGPLRAPVAQGDLRLTSLKLGTEIEGNFDGQFTSDGKNARVSFASTLGSGKLQGQVGVALTGNEMISGKLSVEQFDLDPLIVAGLHLRQLTSHSRADGVFTIQGPLRQPEAIEVDADISRISFDYEFVQLTNDQDIRVTYHRNEVRIEQAHLHGTDTDLTLTGAARFDRDRPIHFMISGAANLRLVQGVLPQLVSQGHAEMNVSIDGTMTQPRIVGRANVRDGSAHYGDFPIGLSKVNGELVFDKSRLVFDRVTAESGGGQLVLSGSLTYGEGALRYQVNVGTPAVRIRYPAGMSWLAGGNVQLSGTSTGAMVSGNVQVQRLLFGEGVDVASFFAAASEASSTPVSTSPLLQNLSFDVQVQTSAGARIEWTGAEIEMDGNVRLRGSWDRPVLLGNIHLLSGEMPFRGNMYELTRGDINFSNPFRLDPVLNVEATSTISQYQVTIDFSGPASHLSLSYRSDPPLPETDIIGLLALGRTGEETNPVSQAASQNYGATALLSEAISSGLGGRIEHLFGISQFRVDPFVAGTATESNAAARVTIEKQITHDLTVTYSSNAATSNQYQLIQVEYEVKRDLSVEFLRDINGTYGWDIKWVKRLK